MTRMTMIMMIGICQRNGACNLEGNQRKKINVYCNMFVSDLLKLGCSIRTSICLVVLLKSSFLDILGSFGNDDGDGKKNFT